LIAIAACVKMLCRSNAPYTPTDVPKPPMTLAPQYLISSPPPVTVTIPMTPPPMPQTTVVPPLPPVVLPPVVAGFPSFKPRGSPKKKK